MSVTAWEKANIEAGWRVAVRKRQEGGTTYCPIGYVTKVDNGTLLVALEDVRIPNEGNGVVETVVKMSDLEDIIKRPLTKWETEMVSMVRRDPEIGNGTLSTIDEATTDLELAKEIWAIWEGLKGGRRKAQVLARLKEREGIRKERQEEHDAEARAGV